MEIKNLSYPLNQVVARTEIHFIRELQVGQRLHATVLQPLPEKNFVQLNLRGLSVRAYTPLNFRSGQILELEVVSSGKLPQLKIVAGSEKEDIVARTMRQHLPKQESLAILQKNLLSLTQHGSDPSALPAPLRPIVRALLQRLPQINDIIRPEGIKHAFQDSGLFLETKLASSHNAAHFSVVNDTKANLLRLLALLKNMTAQQGARPTAGPSGSAISDEIPALSFEQNRNLPVETHRKLSLPPLAEFAELKPLLNKNEGALAKIILDQIASVPKDESGKQTWQLEVPFLNGRNVELMKLRISRHAANRNDQPEKNKWTVLLQLTPPGLDAIHCKLMFHGGQVDTFFWSESEKTANLIKGYLTLLKERYQKAGLRTGYLDAVPGQPPEEQNINRIESLLDEKV